jgi:hypothetical protein
MHESLVQSATPSYYISKTIISFRLATIARYYTFELIPALNPTLIDSNLKCNQLFN